MKKLILLLLLLPCFAMAQTTFPVNDKGIVEYKNTVDVNASKEEIYLRAKTWIAKNFTAPNQVIKMDDEKAGILKLTYDLPFIDDFNITSSLQITYKDNKYQYSFSDIYVLTEPHLQKNMTAEGILTRIKDSKKPSKFLTNYVESGDKVFKHMEKSLIEGLNTSRDF